MSTDVLFASDGQKYMRQKCLPLKTSVSKKLLVNVQNIPERSAKRFTVDMNKIVVPFTAMQEENTGQSTNQSVS